MGFDILFPQFGVVGGDRVFRRDCSFHDLPKVEDEGERVFGEVYLPAKEGHPGAVLLGIVDQLECIEGRAGTTAQDADDELRVVGHQFFEWTGSVIRDFQENGSTGFGHAGQTADDVVVEESRHLPIGYPRVNVWVEDFEKIPESLLFGLDAEIVKGLKCLVVPFDFIGERYGVEPEIGTDKGLTVIGFQSGVLDMIEGGRIETNARGDGLGTFRPERPRCQSCRWLERPG